ncbi:MAG: serine hydrolase [Duodenibacillus sp.]|nr:serine hydrolase [Duodenibacillus sp.]
MRFFLKLRNTLLAAFVLVVGPVLLSSALTALPAGALPQLSGSAAAQAAAPKLPVLNSEARAWIVVDGASGFVMGSHNADLPVNPGDLVQLMTLYTALEMIGGDASRLDEPVTISARDSLRPLSARRLYLVAGEKTPLKTLLNGIAVVAAEDAALAVADHLAGSPEAFADKMNEAARAIGMRHSKFVSPIDAREQQTTARDLATLAMTLYKRHPEAYAWFSQREFAFTNHTQRNRNLMLWKGEGINGVMGNAENTDLVSSWHRPAANSKGAVARDIFSVLIGGRNADLSTNDMLALLRFGRLEFETIRLFEADTTIKKIDILTGNRDELAVGSDKPIWVTVRRQDIVARGTGGFSTTFEYMAPAIAPVSKGDPMGTLHVYFRNKPVADFTLVAMHDVGPGSFLSRFVDSVRLRMKPADEQKKTVTSAAAPEDKKAEQKTQKPEQNAAHEEAATAVKPQAAEQSAKPSTSSTSVSEHAKSAAPDKKPVQDKKDS